MSVRSSKLSLRDSGKVLIVRSAQLNAKNCKMRGAEMKSSVAKAVKESSLVSSRSSIGTPNSYGMSVMCRQIASCRRVGAVCRYVLVFL